MAQVAVRADKLYLLIYRDSFNKIINDVIILVDIFTDGVMYFEGKRSISDTMTVL